MQLKNKKFYTISLGCRANAFETNCISSDLIHAGAQKTKFANDADICIINTCSVTNKADAKSKYFINKILRENQNVLLVVMGCFAQANSDFFKKINNVIVIGNKYKNKVVSLIKEYKARPIIRVESFTNLLEFEKFNNVSFIDNTRAFLKIQDGCNFMCSYCIIPFTRGRQRSLNHKVIIDEINKLKKNYKEIVLTGINTAGYFDDDYCDFLSLLKLINQIKGDFRIRISSIEPFQISKDIIDLISNNPRFVQQFHLCLQSGSDRVLELMNRNYTTQEFKKLCDYIRMKNPNSSITTDYIVGFNSESNNDFKSSIDFLNSVKLSDMHIFPFSLRKYTAISSNKNIVDSKIVKDRIKKISNLNQKLQRNYLRTFLGKKVEVIFEKPKCRNIQSGHSNYFFTVNVKTCRQLHGQKREVIVTKIENNSVFGELAV